VTARININKQELAMLCQGHGISKLAFFGSVVRDDFRSDSDIDVLVEFRPDAVPDLYRYQDIIDGLVALFGRKVDLVTYDAIHPLLRQEILSEAETQYDQAS